VRCFGSAGFYGLIGGEFKSSRYLSTLFQRLILQYLILSQRYFAQAGCRNNNTQKYLLKVEFGTKDQAVSE
jgi:hypothetical protein